MTQMTKNNATKMTAFWTAYWAAKASNNQALMNACERMMTAASKRQPASECDWAMLNAAAQAAQAAKRN